MRTRLLAAISLVLIGSAQDSAFRCPMDPDVRSAVAGSCPRCGMKLLRMPAGALEYPLAVRVRPAPDRSLALDFTIRDPRSGKPVTRFQPVHEKLFHLFVVSQDLRYF